MNYPVRRFIHQALTIPASRFYQETRWDEETIANWEQAHVAITELPIALLEDLSRFSSSQLDITAALEKLQQYQREYLEEITEHRNSFCRIPNRTHLLHDLRQYAEKADQPTLVQTITETLDKRLYQDPFTIAPDWDQQVIPYAERPCATLPTILYRFKVKLFRLPTGEAYPVYHYLGHEVKESDSPSLM